MNKVGSYLDWQQWLTCARVSLSKTAYLKTFLLSILIVFQFLCLSCKTFAFAQDLQVPVVAVLPETKQAQLEDRNDISFRRLLARDGLSQTRVSTIAQDDEGYIWFGTQHGVSRYDGSGYKIFKHERSDPTTLSGIFVYSLFKDRDGRMWVGSDQFLDAYDKTTATFKHYTLAPSNPTVIHISQDRTGLLWLSTAQGLFSLNPTSGIVKRFGHNENDNESLSSSDIKSTGEDREGAFWVATSQGLEQFDRSSGKVRLRIPLRQEVREFGFHEDLFGVFWIYYGSGNGLATYDRKTRTLTQYAYSDSASESSLAGVYAALETRSGEMWFATMGGGLLRFDRDRGIFLRYKHDPTDDQSLAENRVIALFEDREGNVWTGLHAAPPNVFPEEPTSFAKVWPYPRHENQFGEALVNTIFEDSKGAVWLGAGGALNRISADRQALKVFHPIGDNAHVEILAISEDAEGKIWIGTLGAGLIMMNPLTAEFTQFKAEPDHENALQSDVVTRVLVQNAKEIWLTTWNGISKFDPTTGTAVTYKRDPNASSETYFSIVQDGTTGFWLGTTGGLYHFDRVSETFKSYVHNPAKISSLSNNTVNTIYVENPTVVWIGTQNGLNRLDVTTDQFFAFFDRHGLAGNAVSCILPDDDGSLWMSTNKGISRLDSEIAAFETFSTSDGLPGLDFTGWNACAKGASRRLYFAGFSGAAVKIRDSLKNDLLSSAPVVFTHIQAGNSTVTPGAVSEGGDAQTVTIPSRQNQMTVSFAALSFRRPESTLYRYKLEGLDTDWHIATRNQRTVSFASLPSGAFKFVVQASYSRGIWSASTASLNVIVLPAWWRTGWFYLLVLGTAALLIVAIYTVRIRQVAADYRIRLDERLAERSRVARELHDTLLQSFQGLVFRLYAARSLVAKDPQEAVRQLDIILEKSDDALVEGRQTIEMLRKRSAIWDDLVTAIQAVGRELATEQEESKASFNLTTEGQLYDLELRVKEEVYRIIVEALRNAFGHAQAETVSCYFEFSPHRILVRVTDNGVGMQLRDRGIPNSKRWGLEGMKERANKIGGHLMIESVSGCGTTIELIVPVHRPFGAIRSDKALR